MSPNESIESAEKPILEHFRCLVESHKKTKQYQFGDKILLKFLRSRDLNPDEAHKVLMAYLGAINDRPDVFSWYDCFKEIFQGGIYYHYPVRNIDGSKIILIHPGKWKPNEIPIHGLISFSVFYCETSLLDETNQNNGFIVIFDMRGVGWSQLYNCGLSNGKILSDLTDRIIPIKINSIHVVYENRLTDAGYALFKPFLGAKLRSTVNFHGHDLEKLYRTVPKTHLPPSLGGTSEEYSAEFYQKILEEKKKIILSSWKRFKAINSE